MFVVVVLDYVFVIIVGVLLIGGIDGIVINVDYINYLIVIEV